jgi:Spy/CpxP family protein refolding chaperone
MRKLAIVVFSLAVALTGTGLAEAQGGPERFGPPGAEGFQPPSGGPPGLEGLQPRPGGMSGQQGFRPPSGMQPGEQGNRAGRPPGPRENQGGLPQPLQGPPDGPGGPGRGFPGGADNLPPRFHNGGNGPGDGLEMLERIPGLTEDQRNQMRSLLIAFRERSRKARMNVRSLEDEKSTMLLSGKLDQNKMAGIDEEIVKQNAEVERERLKMRREALGLLRPDQMSRLGHGQQRR